MGDFPTENEPLLLSPLGKSVEDGWTTLSWHINDQADGFILQHSIPEDHAGMMTEETRGDHALLVALLHGMRLHRDIHVAGEVCPDLLTNLETLQDIWSRWRPERYRKINISVAEERSLDPHTNTGGLFAFSGGVDGTYTFFRHLTGAAGRRTQRPAAALLVHGMDIPLSEPQMYDKALMRAQRMVEGTGVPILPLRTNSRALKLDWEEAYGLQLIAAMLVLQPAFAAGIHGSGEPWEMLVFPWGSTPFTDTCCETRNFKIHHDGCEASRTEKVDWLMRHTNACKELRVCWQGPQKDRNCGECEKCMRTKLNFWALGHPIPESLPGSISPSAVRRIKPSNSIQLRELQSILKTARSFHPSSDPLLKALKDCVRMGPVSIFSRKVRRKAKQEMKNFLARRSGTRPFPHP